jgi:ribonuclease P protein component
MIFSFPKEERITSKLLFDSLFTQGIGVKVYPLRFTFIVVEKPLPYHIQIAFGVSKKQFKKAVDRNKIKNQLKNIYRTNNQVLKQYLTKNSLNIAVFVSYNSNAIPKFDSVKEKFVEGLNQIQSKLENH